MYMAKVYSMMLEVEMADRAQGHDRAGTSGDEPRLAAGEKQKLPAKQ